MAHARSLKTSARDSEVRGAAKAAPLLNPLRLAERAVAAIAELMRESAGGDFSGGAVAVGAVVPPGGADALREAGILMELLADPRAMLRAYEPTYRLLIGVLLRDPEELLRLRATTIAPLERYDYAHDTDLLGTIETFLGHHGSTTDTAEAMKLHRHTVGYRLARVQEVCGLSPYESDGRERLGLGLKAHRILLAENRRVSPSGP